MKDRAQFVLRKSGAGEMYVKTTPHDFEGHNFVKGREEAREFALCFDTRREALMVKFSDPDGYCLMVEKI